MKLPEKVAQIKAEDLMAHARENGNVKWLKAKAAEIASQNLSNMKAYAALRKAYLQEFVPELLAKKKAAKKGKTLFDRIAEMED